MKETIISMEHYAEENNIPIIELDSIKFIMKYIKLNNVKNILEVGTAIGYSAILMANASPNVEITTIEKDEKRYREAVKNVNSCGLDKRIEIVYNDAFRCQFLIGRSL
jgi:predicted O-methyltransferase YrrM